MQWLAVNLFLLALIGVACVVFLALGSIVRAIDPHPDIALALWGFSAILAAMASYYTGKWLHWLTTRRK